MPTTSDDNNFVAVQYARQMPQKQNYMKIEMHERHQPKVGLRPTGFMLRLFGARTLRAVNSVVTKSRCGITCLLQIYYRIFQ